MAIEIISTLLTPATATAPAQPYDLTTLATLKDELSIQANDTSNDTFLSRAITEISTAIASFCNRVFQAEGLQDLVYIEQDAYPYQVPGGVYPLQLSRWPITADAAIAFKGNTHSSTLIDGLTVAASAFLVGAPITGTGIAAGSVIASVDLVGQTLTLSLAATATASAVALASGQIVVETPYPGGPQVLVLGTDYMVDAPRGWLIKLNPYTGMSTKWPALPIQVQYAAGYDTIPVDVEMATLRLVTGRFRARGRDPTLRSDGQPGLGNQYWVGSMPGQFGPFPPDIADILMPYRVPSVL